MKSNKMFLLMALAAGSLVAGSSAIGQDTTAKLTSMTTNATSHASNMAGGSSTDRLSQKLGLTDAQKEKVQSILGSGRQQARDVRQDTSLSTDQKQSKLTEIRDRVNTKLQSVLTPEQYAKWQNLTHQHRTMSTGSPAGSPP